MAQEDSLEAGWIPARGSLDAPAGGWDRMASNGGDRRNRVSAKGVRSAVRDWRRSGAGKYIENDGSLSEAASIAEYEE